MDIWLLDQDFIDRIEEEVRERRGSGPPPKQAATAACRGDFGDLEEPESQEAR
jgi:hypothetical protein